MFWSFCCWSLVFFSPQALIVIYRQVRWKRKQICWYDRLVFLFLKARHWFTMSLDCHDCCSNWQYQNLDGSPVNDGNYYGKILTQIFVYGIFSCIWRLVFQPLFFRGKLLVFGGVTNPKNPDPSWSSRIDIRNIPFSQCDCRVYPFRRTLLDPMKTHKVLFFSCHSHDCSALVHTTPHDLKSTKCFVECFCFLQWRGECVPSTWTVLIILFGEGVMFAHVFPPCLSMNQGISTRPSTVTKVWNIFPGHGSDGFFTMVNYKVGSPSSFK